MRPALWFRIAVALAILALTLVSRFPATTHAEMEVAAAERWRKGDPARRADLARQAVARADELAPVVAHQEHQVEAPPAEGKGAADIDRVARRAASGSPGPT